MLFVPGAGAASVQFSVITVNYKTVKREGVVFILF